MILLRALPAPVLALAFSILPLAAFNGEQVKEGPLTLAIGEIPDITEPGLATPVTIILSNSGTDPLSVTLRTASPAGDGTITGPSDPQVTVPAGGRAEARFTLTMSDRAEAALYPFPVFAAFSNSSGKAEAHAVRIFRTKWKGDATRPGGANAGAALAEVPVRGALLLTSLHSQRVSFQFFDKPLVEMPAGWTGSDPASGTNLAVGVMDRPQTKPCLTMHPPWRGAAGTMFVSYRLKLPATTPLTFSFNQAIRDSQPSEGKSDGVTFRVRVGEEVLFERHSDSKTWLPAAVDLSRFAGREITLGLECHPGPKHDTSCDSAFWGDPMVVAGPPPARPGEEAHQQQIDQARQAALHKTTTPGAFVFPLSNNRRAAVVLGASGLADAALALAADGKATVIDGFDIRLEDQLLGAWPSGVVVEKTTTRHEGAVVVVEHELLLQGRPTILTARLWADGPALRVRLSSEARLTNLNPGSFDQKATRLYYGHGYCLVEPGKFMASGGGHDLATSQVGLDFPNGLSVLTACDTPPDSFDVDPGRRRYALRTHPDSTFVFLPGTHGALACAIDYRSIDTRQPADGVAVKAGRFVFDLWGGRYAQDAAKLERCFRYGLTDSLVLMHDWQRWGYDYRLPDIFPPAPSLGTLDDLKKLGAICDQHGVRWGLHDNYIDIYPDAEGFSYDHVTFHADGRPRTAWLNEGREAQSYQFRPDHVRPFLERNLALMKEALHPSASFVDVWTSINAFDYYDRDGKFHSKLETWKCWGEGFKLIRETFGDHAPTSSEAGSDQLVGYLDGADCQFLRLAPQGREFVPARPCADWERVPWFDAVLHARFILHGVGYSGRYEGGLPRDLHGIESDDYVGAEMLTGHALMVDLPCLVRGAVRKYWLAQDIAAALKQDAIESVEFADGDIHRQTVRWKSGACVWANRSPADWAVEGRLLPPDGYLARAGGAESSVERINGLVVERSSRTGVTYVNGRTFVPGTPLAIRPEAESIEHKGGRDFRLVVGWEARQSATQDLAVFYHFTRRLPGADKDTEFCPGGDPDPPTSHWQGLVRTGANWPIRLPDNLGAGEYSILVGLYDSRGDGHRAALLGNDDGSRRYRLGTLVVEGEDKPGGAITALRLVKETGPETPRLLPNPGPTDFGCAVTGGGLRLVAEGRDIVVTPLPDGPAFPLVLRPSKFLGRPAKASRVEALDEEGHPTGPVEFRTNGDDVSFTVTPGIFAYRVVAP